MRNIQKKKGFTLIEAILVAVLLGLLAAIAIPKLGQLFIDQRMERAVLDTTLLNQGIALWRADHPGLDFCNGSTGAVDDLQADLDWGPIGAAYNTLGYEGNSTGVLRYSEAAFLLIRPYIGRAQVYGTLAEFIGSAQLEHMYYYFDVDKEIFPSSSLADVTPPLIPL